MTIFKVAIPTVATLGTVSVLAGSGIIDLNWKKDNLNTNQAPSDTASKHEQEDTDRDYFLLANNNIGSMTTAVYSAEDLYTENNNMKTKNFQCQIITDTSASKTGTDGIFDCDIYKYDLQHPISKDISDTEINTPSLTEQLSNKSELFKDSLFQIVVSKEIFDKQKENPNLKIRLLKKEQANNEKWFSNLEGLAWYHKNKIQKNNPKNKTTLLDEINKTINTSYLLTQITIDSDSGMVSNDDNLITNESNSPKIPNYRCKISETDKEDVVTDCYVYSVSETHWKIDSSKIQPPQENDLVTTKTSLVKNKYFQIKLDSKALNTFNNKSNLTIGLVKKEGNTQIYKNLKSLYEFRRGKKNGKIQHIAVQVENKSEVPNNSLSNETTPINYKYTTSVNNLPNTQIFLHNLFGDPNGDITNKNDVNSDASKIRTVNMKSTTEGQATYSTIKNKTILIMSTSKGADNSNHFELYNLVGSKFDIDINILASSDNNSSSTKKGSLIVKVIGTITEKNEKEPTKTNP